ncbi:site-specific integrase [Mammaliicoccus sciuri]|uniref:site-specific integrase n=1 Tax=Mammaliicoccus sciuri TaxID=1296 RepID=UPI001D0CF909|nr:site-specific integrase [Mammaliicoccus sciuri]MCC2087954.1 site-specific integrase [Mammaliicoccus sciuri]
MSVYKDDKTGKWYFVVRVRDHNNKLVQKKRRGFELKKDAKKAEIELLDNYNKTDIDLTFNQVTDRYMEYAIGRKKDTSIYNQKNLIDTLLRPSFGHLKINDITPTHIMKFYNDILPSYSNSYLSNIRRNFSAIFNFAVNFYGIERNVVKIVELPKKPEQKILKFWTYDQFYKFLDVVDNIVYRNAFLVLFWSGIRKGELLALRIKDIDFKNHTISIMFNWNGKEITSVKNTPSERIINIPDHVIQELVKLIDHHKEYGRIEEDTDFLFSVKALTKPMSPANVNKKLREYIELTDLPQIRVHHLRHSHVALLINHNIPMYTISKHLGHSNIQTTANIYGHLYPNTEKELENVLNDFYNNSVLNKN